MLRSMREGAKSPIMKLFLLFLAAGFALWGVGDLSGGFLSGGNNAVSAGDRKVGVEDAAYEFERSRRVTGRGLAVGEAIQAGLLNEVMGNLARETLFGAEADRLGVTVTRDMKRDSIANDPQFKDELGQFAEGRFLQTLRSSGFTEESYLEKLSSALEVTQIVAPITDGGIFASTIANQVSAYQLEQRQASYLSFTPDSESIPTPSDSDLTSWFTERQSQYDAPDLRSFDVIFLSADRLQNTITPREEDIVSSFDIRRDEFVTPERRAVRQMVFDAEEEARAALSDITAGTAFNAVASARLNWTEDDVTLGIVRREELADELAEAAFNAEIGTAFGPVSSAFGYHVAVIDSIEPASDVGLDDVRPAIIAALQSEQAIDLIYDHVTKIEDAFGTGASLSEAAALIGTTVISISDIDRNGLTIDGELYQAEDASDLTSDTLFLGQAWALEIDEMSTVIESVDDSFFVIQPTNETPSRTRPLDEVKARAIADWKTEQALMAAITSATEAMARGDDGFANSVITEPFRRSGAGLDHSAASLIAAAAFGQKKGDIQLIETGTEVLVLRTDEIMPADDKETEDFALRLLDGFNDLVRNDIASAMALSLSETHKLEVNAAPVQQALIGSQSY